MGGRRTSALLVVVGIWISQVALTAPATGAVNERKAQRQVKKAEAALRAGDYRQALDWYSEAYDMAPNPAILCMIGRAHQLLDDPQAALVKYRACLKEELPEALRAKIQSEFERLNQEFGKAWVTFSIKPDGAQLILDGKSIGAAPVEKQEIKSGPHVLEVKAEGYISGTQTLVVVPDQDQDVQLALKELPKPPPVIDPSLLVKPKSPYWPWQWVTMATGGALVIVGGVVWALAQSDYDQADKGRRNHTMSYQKGHDLYDQGNTKRTSGAVLMGVGGAALAASAALLALDLTWKPAPKADPDKPEHRPLPIVPEVGLLPVPGGGMFSLGGRF